MKRIAASNPLRQTSWIWPESYMYLYNHYAQFRRDFELASKPAKALFYITADSAYKLYVNGEYVCRGPARGYQSHWPCDEVDLAPFLRKGHNWVSVEGYNPGISTFKYLHKNFAGLLCAPAKGKLADAWAKSKWAMRRDPARSTQTARLSLQIDFQEHIDLSKDDRSWIFGETPPEGWQPRVFPNGHSRLENPFGMPPFDDVEERGIPLLREPMLELAGVTAHGVGRNGEGYREYKNVSWPFIREAQSQKIAWDSAEGVKSRKLDGALEIVIEPPGEGLFRAITVFNGEYAMGCLSVEADGALGGEIIDFNHYQYLRDGKPEFINAEAACLVAMANRMKLREGYCKHEFFHPIASGHFTVMARDVKAPLTLRLRYRRVEYPFEMKGSFESSDAVLNNIHAACRRTQQLCSLDAYVDTPWREQAQWWGDARVQARNTFFLDGDSRLFARGIESIGGQELLSGLTPGHAPTSGTWCILPDFTLTWLVTIWDYYYQTGDISLFKNLMPRVKTALAYYDNKAVRASNGLLKYDKRFWLFEDWSDLPKNKIPCFLNLWYSFACRKTAELFALAGKSKDAAKLIAKAEKIEALLLDLLFDAPSGLFRPELDASLKPAGDASVHDQILAMMLGLKPEAHAKMLESVILPYMRGELQKGAKPSAFWAAYVIEEMVKRGYGEETLSFIKRGWEPMTSTGTTWEDFTWDEKSSWSACHAWTAHPSSYLVNLLAGINQADAAWSKIEVKPFFAKGMDHVKALVPSPKGAIEMEWRREGASIKGSLKLPQGIELKLNAGDAQIAVERY